MKREVQIKLKAVSADHCNITYEGSKGWFISESGKDKVSSNGTFVFMKSQQQMQNHEPSDLIPLHDGMVISFINYEIRVNLEKKTGEAIEAEDQKIRQRSNQLRETANLAGTMKATTPHHTIEETKHHDVVEEKVEVVMAAAEAQHAAAEYEPEEDHQV